jgi:hypothetical protein
MAGDELAAAEHGHLFQVDADLHLPTDSRH